MRRKKMFVSNTWFWLDTCYCCVVCMFVVLCFLAVEVSKWNKHWWCFYDDNNITLQLLLSSIITCHSWNQFSFSSDIMVTLLNLNSTMPILGIPSFSLCLLPKPISLPPLSCFRSHFHLSPNLFFQFILSTLILSE